MALSACLWLNGCHSMTANGPAILRRQGSRCYFPLTYAGLLNQGLELKGIAETLLSQNCVLAENYEAV